MCIGMILSIPVYLCDSTNNNPNNINVLIHGRGALSTLMSQPHLTLYIAAVSVNQNGTHEIQIQIQTAIQGLASK